MYILDQLKVREIQREFVLQKLSHTYWSVPVRWLDEYMPRANMRRQVSYRCVVNNDWLMCWNNTVTVLWENSMMLHTLSHWLHVSWMYSVRLWSTYVHKVVEVVNAYWLYRPSSTLWNLQSDREQLIDCERQETRTKVDTPKCADSWGHLSTENAPSNQITTTSSKSFYHTHSSRSSSSSCTHSTLHYSSSLSRISLTARAPVHTNYYMSSL